MSFLFAIVRVGFIDLGKYRRCLCFCQWLNAVALQMIRILYIKKSTNVKMKITKNVVHSAVIFDSKGKPEFMINDVSNKSATKIRK